MAELEAEFVSDSNKVTTIKIGRSTYDFMFNKCAFHPLMSHQIFGLSESIFGYKELGISICYTASRLNAYIGYKYKEEVADGEVQPDDVINTIGKKMLGGYFTNYDQFIKTIPDDFDFKPFGLYVDSFPLSIDKWEEPRNFIIYTCDIFTEGFLPYHEKMQTFLLWFVDAANFIDVTDKKWHFLICYEKYLNVEAGKYCFAFIGYATIYEYYAHPRKIRPRLSQVFVLPPFQKLGIGAKLLQSAYTLYITQHHTKDITVEGPSDSFKRIRDYVDCSYFLSLKREMDYFKQSKFKMHKILIQAIHKKIKFNKKQIRRLLEIAYLQFCNSNVSNANDKKKFEEVVKRRLKAELQKRRYRKRFRSVIAISEDDSKQIDEEYNFTIDQYNSVLRRLNTFPLFESSDGLPKCKCQRALKE